MNRKTLRSSWVKSLVISSVILGIVFFTIVVVPQSYIKEVRIDGKEDIFSDISFFQKKRNLLFLSLRVFTEELKKGYPLIESVKIEKKFPDTIILYIEERKPVVKVQAENQNFYLDKEGNILPPLERYSSIYFPGFECQFELENGGVSGRIKRILPLIDEVMKDKEFILQKVRCIENDFELIFSESRVLVTEKTHPLKTAASLQFLFKQFRIEGTYPRYVDLRFEKPVLIPEGLPDRPAAGDATASATTE